jgi:hypothetical protein
VDLQPFFNSCDDIAIRSDKEQNTTILKRVLQLTKSKNLKTANLMADMKQSSKESLSQQQAY